MTYQMDVHKAQADMFECRIRPHIGCEALLKTIRFALRQDMRGPALGLRLRGIRIGMEAVLYDVDMPIAAIERMRFDGVVVRPAMIVFLELAEPDERPQAMRAEPGFLFSMLLRTAPLPPRRPELPPFCRACRGTGIAQSGSNVFPCPVCMGHPKGGR